MNAAIEAWKAEEIEIGRDLARRMESLTPEPLFETNCIPRRSRLCLVCCECLAKTTLWSSHAGRSIVPMCSNCSSRWNIYGYYILKRLYPLKMIWKLLKYKLTHLFRSPKILDIAFDVTSLLRWSRKMASMKASRA
jgi:hypothetical protein